MDSDGAPELADVARRQGESPNLNSVATELNLQGGFSSHEKHPGSPRETWPMATSLPSATVRPLPHQESIHQNQSSLTYHALAFCICTTYPKLGVCEKRRKKNTTCEHREEGGEKFQKKNNREHSREKRR